MTQSALKWPLAGIHSLQATLFLFTAATCISPVRFLVRHFGAADKTSMAQELVQPPPVGANSLIVLIYTRFLFAGSLTDLNVLAVS